MHMACWGLSFSTWSMERSCRAPRKVVRGVTQMWDWVGAQPHFEGVATSVPIAGSQLWHHQSQGLEARLRGLGLVTIAIVGK